MSEVMKQINIYAGPAPAVAGSSRPEAEPGGLGGACSGTPQRPPPTSPPRPDLRGEEVWGRDPLAAALPPSGQGQPFSPW